MSLNPMEIGRYTLSMMMFVLSIFMVVAGGVLSMGEHGGPEPYIGSLISVLGLQICVLAYRPVRGLALGHAIGSLVRFVLAFCAISMLFGLFLQLTFMLAYHVSPSESGATPLSFLVWAAITGVVGLVDWRWFERHTKGKSGVPVGN